MSERPYKCQMNSEVKHRIINFFQRLRNRILIPNFPFFSTHFRAISRDWTLVNNVPLYSIRKYRSKQCMHFVDRSSRKQSFLLLLAQFLPFTLTI